MIEFAIYSLPVGGGVLALSPMPGRTRHYHTDWQHLIAWKPDLVLTMTTKAELERKGAGTLGPDLLAAGIGWLHLPVTDFGVPEGMDWAGVHNETRSVLANSGRVLIHCFGGCGRSGMMVLRMMIAAGETGDAALARLRQIRPCAVETDAQLAWAMQDDRS
jgi:protein-tyrosine phosphatase